MTCGKVCGSLLAFEYLIVPASFGESSPCYSKMPRSRNLMSLIEKGIEENDNNIQKNF